MKILLERLKSLGIEDPTEEQKKEQQEIISQEIQITKAATPKKKWESMNLLAKELREIVV